MKTRTFDIGCKAHANKTLKCYLNEMPLGDMDSGKAFFSPRPLLVCHVYRSTSTVALHKRHVVPGFCKKSYATRTYQVLLTKLALSKYCVCFRSSNLTLWIAAFSTLSASRENDYVASHTSLTTGVNYLMLIHRTVPYRPPQQHKRNTHLDCRSVLRVLVYAKYMSPCYMFTAHGAFVTNIQRKG